MKSILNEINKPNDIKNISSEDYDLLCNEIREFIIKSVSENGGHLAASLGVVELTVALHLFLDLPKDKLIWDVGHQSYTHKILTGRKEEFNTLRKLDGISGFPKGNESQCDAFDTGHSSTSISAALGFVKARELSGNDEKIVAVIGDGALTGGLALEALNNAGRLKSNLIIVLNDNKMSISENVGALSSYLGKLRTNPAYTSFKDNIESALSKVPHGHSITKTLKRSKDSIKHLLLPNMFFENMGITYIGPVDGHNIGQMLNALKYASLKNNAIILHVVTKKGKGYEKAESNACKYHSIGPFNYETGETIKNSSESYTNVFSDIICDLAEKDKKIVAVTAAMATGTGLSKFAEKFPDRFVDVGIAESHAVTFSAGMAKAGLKPVVAVYSTFLQRAFDQILHDVCINSLPVVFAIDRAGIVGRDGETHQGVFDLSYLSMIPGMTVMSPKNVDEMKEMFKFAFILSKPVAIRYPRSQAYFGLTEYNAAIEYGKSEVIHEGRDKIAVIAVGNMVEPIENVRKMFIQDNIDITTVNARFVSPVDEKMITKLAKENDILVTVEDNIKNGGFGEKVSSIITENNLNQIKFLNISLPDIFIKQGSIRELRKIYSLDDESIYERIKDANK